MRWTTVPSPVGELTAVTDGTALAGLDLPGAALRRGERDDRHPVLRRAAVQLGEYFAGERSEFGVPLALAGSDFERRVWTALLEVPYGDTVTDAEIAARAGQPMAARAVVMACGYNPVAVIVPAHRMVAAGGSGGLGAAGSGSAPGGSGSGSAGGEVGAWLRAFEAGVVARDGAWAA